MTAVKLSFTNSEDIASYLKNSGARMIETTAIYDGVNVDELTALFPNVRYEILPSTPRHASIRLNEEELLRAPKKAPRIIEIGELPACKLLEYSW